MVFQNTTYDINFRVFDEPVLPKWWTKVLYHSPVIEPFEEDVVLAFDLDVVIKGSIDPLFDWVEQQDYLCAVWCRWREHMDNFEEQRDKDIFCTPYNSSILGWKPDTCLKIWEEFVFEDIEKYNGTLIISNSCWQSMTAFEEKVGNQPDLCKVPVLNLKTGEIKILDFEGEE